LEEITLPQLLKEANYSTGMIGEERVSEVMKWTISASELL
jgi:hypothetical protein